jgi:hypothetical protein
METNGRLGARETQLVSTNGVDIGVQGGREKDLQKRAQNLGSPLSNSLVISGRGF